MKTRRVSVPLTARRSVVAVAVATALYAPAPALLAQGVELEEIVVTATKRSENIQNIPVSISAVSAADLIGLGINSILSLDKAIPGLIVNNRGNDPTIIMRGAGSAGTRDLAVPIYIDSQYRPNAGQALASYFDVERVEVLKGPQGTLFGRNTLGGLVNVIVKKPDRSAFSYGGALTLGDYNLQRLEGFINAPIGDVLALRVTASEMTHDPYVENTFKSSAGLKDADEQYARAQLMWTPAESLDITFSASYWKDTANGNADYAYKVLGIPVNPVTGQTNGVSGIIDPRQGIRVTTTPTPTCPDGRTWAGGRPQAGNICNGDESARVISDPYKVAWDYRPEREIEETSFGALVNWDLGFATLTGNFGYFDYSELRLTDTDMSSNAALVAGQNTESKAYQADVNLNSSGDGPLKWTAGLFYYDDSDGANTGAFLWGYTYSSPQRPEWAYWLYQGVGGTKSTAVYGQAEYAFNDHFSMTAGLRYSEDDVNSYTKYVDQNTLNDRLPKYIRDPDRTVKISGKDDHTDYRLALQYRVNDAVMLYASNATGYIGGAIQEGNTGNLLDPTEVDAYEVGVKSTLLGGSMRLNAAYYHNDYTGLTTTVFIQQGGTILAQSIPGGSTKAQGVEVELDWAATDQLRLSAGLAVGESKFDKFNVGNQFTEGSDIIVGTQGFFVMDDKKTRFSPDLTASLGATYDVSLGDFGRLVPGAYAYYSDSYKLSNAPYFWSNQDSYTTLDLNATWWSPSSKVSLRAYVNNVTDEAIRTEATVYSRGRAMLDYAAPRTWGLRAAYNF